ncbi:RHS repeat-associated core domain-containing protein [Embleya sp. AB8]|uniref:RHS repeat-associated core domain-containing protein n=1 Tax=Embleya sp. AB8 TaxID=3156304 RepID=UPI003C768FF7
MVIRARVGLVGVVIPALLSGLLSSWAATADDRSTPSRSGALPPGVVSVAPTAPPPLPNTRTEAKPGEALYEARERLKRSVAERESPPAPPSAPVAMSDALRANESALERRGAVVDTPNPDHLDIARPPRVEKGPRLAELPLAKDGANADLPRADPAQEKAPAPGKVSRPTEAAAPRTGAIAADKVYGAQYASPSAFTVDPTYAQRGYAWVTITNDSNFTWPADSPIRLSYHVYRPNGTIYNLVGLSTPLPITLEPGHWLQMSTVVEQLPAGAFKIVWDLLDGGSWFTEHGVPGVTWDINLPHQPPSARAYTPTDGSTQSTLDTSFYIGVFGDDTQPIDIEYELCAQGGSSGPQPQCRDSGWLRVGTPTQSFSMSHHWTPPSGWILWNTTYRWRVRVRDAAATTPWSGQASLTTIVQPVEGLGRLGVDPTSVDAAGVGLFRGNYTRREIDMAIPGRGLPLQIERIYNSANPTRGVFGQGWSSVLDMRSATEADGSVLITYADGRRVRYGHNPDGGYVAAYGEGSGAEVSGPNEVRMEDGTRYLFNANGRLTTIVGASGQAQFLTYDTQGRPASIREGFESWSRTLYFGWVDGGIGWVATGPNGVGSARWQTYSYQNGYLAGTCEATNWCHSYRYGYAQPPDSIARMVYVEGTRPGIGTEIFYTGDYVGLVKFADGAAWTYVRGPGRSANGALVVKVHAPNGLVTQYEFDARASLWYRWTGENPTPSTTKVWGYDAFGRPSSTLDENGNVTETYWGNGRATDHNTYRDANTIVNTHLVYHLGLPNDPWNGRLVGTQDANGHKTSYSYETADSGNEFVGLVESSTAADGGVTRRTYTCVNPEPRPLVVNDPGAPLASLQPCGLVRSVTDPDGRVTRYEYNRFGDQTRAISPSGQVTDAFYDDLGQAVRRVVDGVETTYTYDAVGRVATVTDAAVTNPISGVRHQRHVRNLYDGDGNLTERRDTDLTPYASGGDVARVTAYKYDVRGRRTEELRDGQTVGYTTYGPMGEVLTSMEPNTNTYSFTYDSFGRLSETWLRQYTEPGTRTERPVRIEARAYDPVGRLTFLGDSMNRWVTYGYTTDDLRLTETLTVYHDPVTNQSRDIPLRTLTYDRAGNVLTDVKGGGDTKLVTALGYDDANRNIATTIDPGGVNRVTTTAYSKAGTLLRTARSDGRDEVDRSTHIYDARGRLTATATRSKRAPADPGLLTSFRRDTAGRVLSTTDPRGTPPIGSTDPPDARFTTDQTYDVLGRVSTITGPPIPVEDGAGGPTRSERPVDTRGYNTFGELTHTRDALGRVTTTVYDVRGRRIKIVHPQVTNPDGSTVSPSESWWYDDAGNPTAYQDRSGQVTRTEYDNRNRPFRVTLPPAADKADPYVVTTVRDDAGNVLSQRDSLGAQQLWTYDGMDRMLTSAVTQRGFGGQVKQFVTGYRYDDLGRLLEVTSPTKTQSTRYTYNAAGDRLTETVAGHGSTRYEYDPVGRLTKTVDPVGRSRESRLDFDGTVSSVVDTGADGSSIGAEEYTRDAVGNVTRLNVLRGGSIGWTSRYLEYDAESRLTSLREGVADPTVPGQTTTFGYDPVGNRVRTTDPLAHSTYTAYNAWDLPSTRTEPATAAQPAPADRTWNTSYDAAGRTTTAVEPGGVVRKFEYDRLGRTVRDSGTGADRAAERTFSYDAAGRVTGSRSGNTTTLYEYDDRGLLTTASGPVIGRTVYAYDDDGRVTNRVGPSAVDGVGWSYDRSDLATVSDTMSGIQRTYTHDAAGRTTGEEQKRGIKPLATRAYTYDQAGRLDSDTVRDPAGGVTAKQSFRWDLQGNLVGSKTEGALAGTKSQDYTYDFAGRLTSDYDPAAGTGTDYTWDAVGNRTAATKWEGTPDKHVATGGSSFSYDERNRITRATDPAGGTTDYTWRPTGTLASTTNRTVGKPVVTTNQTFDAFARLIGDGTSAYTYDAFDRLTSEKNTAAGSGHTFGYTGFDKEPATDGQWWFSRAGSTVLGARNGAPDVTFAAGSGGGLPKSAAADPGAAATYGVLANAHHDVVALTDSTTGAVSGSRAFDAFGRVTASTGVLAPLGFQGSWTDESTGRVQAQARWYDPKTGSFASGDTASVPFVGAASTNRYTYAEGNPTSRWDPSGHFWGIDLGFDLEDVGHLASAALHNVHARELVNAVGRETEQLARSAGGGVASGAVSAGRQAARVVKSAAFRNGVRFAIRGLGGAVEAIALPEELVIGAVVLVVVGGIALYVVINADGTGTPVEDGRRRDPLPQQAPGGDTGPKGPKSQEKPVDATPTPPAAPSVVGSYTGRTSNTVSTVTKWFDSTFAYTRTDWYRLTVVHQWNRWSDGTETWAGTGWAKQHWWRTVAQPLIDLKHGVHVAVNPTPRTATAPALPIQAPPSGSCGAGGPISACGDGIGTGSARPHSLGRCTGNFDPTDAIQACRTADPPSSPADPNTRLEPCKSTTGAGAACGNPDPACHSFPTDTRVLLADGTHKPIQDIKPGDKVLATDPASGRSTPREVLKTFTTENDKDFADITVKTDQGNASLTATTNHPFWAPDLKQWVHAGNLAPGRWLQTSQGTWVQVDAVRTFHHRQRTYDLTVDIDHTYHVLAGSAPVLVHNCGGHMPGHAESCMCNGIGDDIILKDIPAAYGEDDTGGGNHIGSRDIHGVLASGDDQMTETDIQDLVANADQVLWQGSGGSLARVYLRRAAHGKYDAVIRRFEDGGPITSFRNLTESSYQKRLNDGRWYHPNG